MRPLFLLVALAMPVHAAGPSPRPLMTPQQREKAKAAEADFREGSQLVRRGKPRDAVRMLARAASGHQAVHGALSRQAGKAFNYLAIALSQTGQHDAALAAYRRALAAFNALRGPTHRDCLAVHSNVASCYLRQGKAREARQVLERALVLGRKGGDRETVARLLDSLAQALADLGDIDQALKHAREALALARLEGRESDAYQQSLNNLASLLLRLGEPRSALPLLEEAVQLRKKSVGEKHPAYASALANLAYAYQDLGEERLAIPLLTRALAIFKGRYGPRGGGYLGTLNNLASAHERAGDFPRALGLYKELVETVPGVFGPKHPYNAISLLGLSYTLQRAGRNREAQGPAARAVRLIKEVIGRRSDSYASALGTLSSAYGRVGDRHRAVTLMEECVEVCRQVRGEGHPSTLKNLASLAGLLHAQGASRQARALLERSLEGSRERLEQLSYVQSESQQLAAARDMEVALALRLSLPGEAAAYRHVMAWKGLVLGRQVEQRRFARLLEAEKSEEARKLLGRLREASRELSALALAAPLRGPKAKRLEELTQEREKLQRQLAGLSEAFREGQKRATPSPEALAKALPPNAALVDFHSYFDEKRRSRRLTAFVLRPGKRLVRVNYGEPAAEIAKLAGRWREALQEGKTGREEGAKLRRVLWAPLEKLLAGAKVVAVSPDAPVNTIPLAALPGANPGTYLLEEVAIVVVPVPSLLPGLLARKAPAGEASALLVGGVDFGAPGKKGKEAPWVNLPATRLEAAAVGKLFKDRFPRGGAVRLGEKAATHAAMLRELGRHRYAHLATHGFFSRPGRQPALEAGTGRDEDLFGREGAAGWNPLLLSGLVLAGANASEEGTVTALEVSEANLDRLELAVLSACETGLGKEARREGTLGLQRAFQVAGCRAVVSSLWSVHDAATSVLMERFYEGLWGKEKLSKAEALRRAQLYVLRHPEAVEKRLKSIRDELAMRGEEKLLRGVGKVAEKLPGRVGRSSPPAWWAAFVLSGDWR